MRKKLIEEYPHFIEEWVTEKNDRPIEEITIGSDYKAWWKCKKCSHQWKATIGSRTKGTDCPLCVGRTGISLSDKFPQLSEEWMLEENHKPINSITAGSAYKAWWKCKTCDNQWQKPVNQRVKGSGCPKCAGKDKGLLVDQSPQLVEEWVTEKNDRPIEEITIGSDYKAWWKCKKCNREWHALVISRAINNSGCPKCAKIKKKPELI